MANFTTEIIEKAKGTKSAHELLELAKAEGIDITADEAATYFAQLNPESGELSADELDGVSGGGCGDDLPLYRNYTMVQEFFCTSCFRVYPASKCKVPCQKQPYCRGGGRYRTYRDRQRDRRRGK